MTAREHATLTDRKVALTLDVRPLPARLSPRATLPSRHTVIQRLIGVALTAILVVGYLIASQADYLAAGGVG